VPTYQAEPRTEEQPAHHAHDEHHEDREQSEDTGHIHHPQPIPPPITEVFHRPPSPEPESPKFEAPRAEWDASR